jgi:capsular polysaccharide biosynthesis protein
MDTVTILRDLWRNKLIVLGVAVLALFAGIAVVYKIHPPSTLESRKYKVGVASARILVDTPRSQVVEVDPKGSDSLGVRANLLASLMVDGVVKDAIARRAGLSSSRLVGVTDAAVAPAEASEPPTRHDFVLTTHVVTNNGGAELPIIEVDAQAPDVAGAARLGNAAVEGLRDYLNSKAALQRVRDADRVQIIGLGAPQAAMSVRGPSAILGLVAAIVVFLLGCGGIILILALRRGLRAAAAREALGEDPYNAAPAPAAAAAERSVDDWLAPAPPARPRPAKRPTVPAPPSGGGWLSAPQRPSLVVTAPDDDERAESA